MRLLHKKNNTFKIHILFVVFRKCMDGTGNTVVWEGGTAVIDNSGTGNTLLPAN